MGRGPVWRAEASAIDPSGLDTTGFLRAASALHSRLLDHQRRAVDADDTHLASGQQFGPGDAPGRIVDADAALAARHRRLQPEDAADQPAAAIVEAGRGIGFLVLAARQQAAREDRNEAEAGEDQGRGLPAEIDQADHGAGQERGEAEPEQEDAGRQHLAADEDEAEDDPAPGAQEDRCHRSLPQAPRPVGGTEPVRLASTASSPKTARVNCAMPPTVPASAAASIGTITTLLLGALAIAFSASV